MHTPTTIGLLFALALTGAACDNNRTITPTTPAQPQTEIFSGTLAPQTSSFYSFTVATSGSVSITLASLVPVAPGPAATTVMGLGVGTPNGTDCDVTNSVTTAPGLTAQLVNSLTAATYCAKIYDLGSLTSNVNFTVRIVHP